MINWGGNSSFSIKKYNFSLLCFLVHATNSKHCTFVKKSAYSSLQVPIEIVILNCNYYKRIDKNASRTKDILLCLSISGAL